MKIPRLALHATFAASLAISAAGAMAQEGVLLPPMWIPSDEQAAEPPAVLGVLAPLTGEPANGFPNWSERVMHEWINRARVDPQADLAGCGANCTENIGGCYTPQSPLIWNPNAGRSARYHCAEMGIQKFFNHPSSCTLVSNLNSLYPGTCDGSASCACVGGTSTCNPTCTNWDARLALFGVGASGEIIAAGYSDSNAAFYGWLWESAGGSSTCAFSSSNGHRWLILKSTSAVGTGYQSVPGSPWGVYYTGDFGGSNSPIPKIPSGVHYPQQASSIAFWANWKDTAAPRSAAVNVDGACTTMALGRGSATNGAYTVTASGLGSGCHRYYFDFVDSTGAEVTYPTTGSYGIGTSGCADWDTTRPASCLATAGPRFYTVAPCRALDTRNATGTYGGPAIAAGATRAFPLANQCGVPSTATSVSLNVTAPGPAATGQFVLYAGGTSAPSTNTISVKVGTNRANNSLVRVSTDGTATINVLNSSSGTANVVVDVNGYFQ